MALEVNTFPYTFDTIIPIIPKIVPISFQFFTDSRRAVFFQWEFRIRISLQKYFSDCVVTVIVCCFGLFNICKWNCITWIFIHFSMVQIKKMDVPDRCLATRNMFGPVSADLEFDLQYCWRRQGVCACGDHWSLEWTTR